ncbi:MAG: hypothetical protein ACRD0P_06050 [Stackebrandtia sp.]
MEFLARRPGLSIGVSLSVAAVAIATFVYFQGGFGGSPDEEEEKEPEYAADKDPCEFLDEDAFEVAIANGGGSGGDVTEWECDGDTVEDDDYYLTGEFSLRVWVHSSAADARSEYESSADMDEFDWQDIDLMDTEEPADGDWEQGTRAEYSDDLDTEAEGLYIQDGNLRLMAELSAESGSSAPDIESVVKDVMKGLAK